MSRSSDEDRHARLTDGRDPSRRPATALTTNLRNRPPINNFNTIVALLGRATLVLSLGSRLLSRSPLPPTLLALVIRVLVGPEVFNLINPEKMSDRPSLMEKATRLSLASVS